MSAIRSRVTLTGCFIVFPLVLQLPSVILPAASASPLIDHTRRGLLRVSSVPALPGPGTRPPLGVTVPRHRPAGLSGGSKA